MGDPRSADTGLFLKLAQRGLGCALAGLDATLDQLHTRQRVAEQQNAWRDVR
jgi:hypothetical protein